MNTVCVRCSSSASSLTFGHVVAVAVVVVPVAVSDPEDVEHVVEAVVVLVVFTVVPLTNDSAMDYESEWCHSSFRDPYRLCLWHDVSLHLSPLEDER